MLIAKHGIPAFIKLDVEGFEAEALHVFAVLAGDGRGVLLPAAMAVLGRHNWYLPTWLRWLPGRTEPQADTLPGPEHTRSVSPSPAHV